MDACLLAQAATNPPTTNLTNEIATFMKVTNRESAMKEEKGLPAYTQAGRKGQFISTTQLCLENASEGELVIQRD